MSSWNLTRLGELGTIYDGPHATPTRRKEGKYFLNIASLDSGRLDLSQSDHVDDDDFERWTKRVQPQENDLLFSYETRLGEAALMPGGVDACLGRRMALLRPLTEVIDPKFLLYTWLSPWFRGQIERKAIRGATVDRIPLTELSGWSVRLPKCADQRAIGEVLGALDDKINANRRAMLAIDAHLETLFVKLAVSYRTCRVSEVARVNGEVRNPRSGEGLKYIDISSLRNGEFLPPLALPWEDAPGRARRGVRRGDVLWSTVRPNRRSHALNLSRDSELVASTGIAVLTPVKVSSVELFQATKLPEFQEYLEAVAEGSAYPAVRPKLFDDAPLKILQQSDRERFERVADAQRNLQWCMRLENLRLAATRDELLPLLMSGKITVKDAEKTVEEVV